MSQNEAKFGNNEVIEPEISDSDLRYLGFWLSAGYIAIFASIAFLFTDWNSRLEPNELGDFLAGAFAPLAFLWLVLGFLQQGRELRNSAKALHLQVDELRNSVEQSRQMVEVTRNQLELDRQAVEFALEKEKEETKPQFRLSGGVLHYSINEATFRYKVTNVGGECTNVRLSIAASNCPSREIKRIDHMRTDSEFEVDCKLNTANVPRWQFVLQYQDVFGSEHEATSNAWFDQEGKGHDVRFVKTPQPKR